jgi:glycosyltransferase involved in cell wall biosynthesis
MARIYLDARAASSVASGIYRYCSGLIPELAAQAPSHEFIVIRLHETTAPFTSAANVREVTMGRVRGALPLLMSTPQLRRLFGAAGPADVYHALFHLLPFGARRRGVNKVVVTLHDLIWIDHAREVERNPLAAAWRRRLALTAIPYALRSADHVICDSEATARGAARWVAAERCTAVHLGVGPDFFAPAIGEAASGAPTPSRPYIAAFGVAKAYKNIRCLVQAFAALREERPDLRLILIGGDGGVPTIAPSAKRSDGIVVMRAVSDPAVREIIRSAEAFVLPSTVEGFGLPVIEAMALGTPVIVSDIPALREVAGDAAIAFDAADPGQLAQALRTVLASEDLARQMAARGRLRARAFRWSDTAARTLAVYEELLGTDAAPGLVSTSSSRH